MSPLPDLRRVGLVSLDTETNDVGLRAERGSSWPWKDGHVAGISVAWREGGEVRSQYIPLRHPDSDNFESPKSIAGSPTSWRRTSESPAQTSIMTLAGLALKADCLCRRPSASRK
jgi:hypothetical protein